MKIHAYYSNRDKFYIVSELLTGGELFDRIQDLDGFGEKEAAGVMQQLLRALRFNYFIYSYLILFVTPYINSSHK